jgi:hypothetical protein
MRLFNPLLHLRGVYLCGYSTPCYTEEGCMNVAIQPLATLKRARNYRAIQPLVTLKRGVCLGLLNILLHVRGVYVWGYSTPCYT